MMHRVCVGLTVLGLALGPLRGCAGAPSARPSSRTPARPTPLPGRVLAQSIDDPVARHTALCLGPHDPKDVIDLAVVLRLSAPGNATEAITTWARRAGFIVAFISPGTLIGMTAPTVRVEQVLHVSIDDYRLPGPGGYVFLANDRPPTVPAALTSIQVISGLSTYLRAHVG